MAAGRVWSTRLNADLGSQDGMTGRDGVAAITHASGKQMPGSFEVQ